MTVRLENGRLILARQFASIPALGDLPEIRGPDDFSVSTPLSRRGMEDAVDLSEGCLVTNIVSYPNQLVQMINPTGGSSEDRTLVENLILRNLGVIPADTFTLDDPCNFAYLERSVHISFDAYSFIAITPSLPTLENLTKMVEQDNCRRQQHLNKTGESKPRSLDFSSPFFTSPEYELVALHPDYFLPQGTVLTVYNRETETRKNYMPATDGYLRESANTTSPRLPPFRHGSRPLQFRLNIFLVILNADIKFQRYFKLIQQSPPSNSLPGDVITLMNLTMKLVDLLYWTPTPTEEDPTLQSLSRAGLAKKLKWKKLKTRNVATFKGSAIEMSEWFDSVDLKTRMAFGRSIMCGHDPDYDPALFGDAFPLTLNASDLDSESGAIEDWQ